MGASMRFPVLLATFAFCGSLAAQSGTITIRGKTVQIGGDSAAAATAIRTIVDPPNPGSGDPVTVTWLARKPSTHRAAGTIDVPGCRVVEATEMRPLTGDDVVVAEVLLFSTVGGTVQVPPREFFDNSGVAATAPAVTINFTPTATPDGLPRGTDLTMRVDRPEPTERELEVAVTIEGRANLFDADPPRLAGLAEKAYTVAPTGDAVAVTDRLGRLAVRRSWAIRLPRHPKLPTRTPAIEFDFFDLTDQSITTLTRPGFTVEPPVSAVAAPEPADARAGRRAPDLSAFRNAILATLAWSVLIGVLILVWFLMRKGVDPEVKAAIRFLGISSQPDVLLQALESQLQREPPLRRVEMEKPAAALRELLFARGDAQQRISLADSEIEKAAVAMYRARRLQR